MRHKKSFPFGRAPFGNGKLGRCDRCDAVTPDDVAFTFDEKTDDKRYVPFTSLDDPERLRVCRKCARQVLEEEEQEQRT